MPDNRFRFGLRSFLLVTATIAVIIGIVGLRLYRDNLRRQAARIIEDQGAQVVKDNDEFIVRVLFDSIKFDDQQFISLTRHLRMLPRLNELDLVRVKVSDEHLLQIEPIERLKTLYLFETDVTEQGIAKLKRSRPDLDIKLTQPDPIASSLIAATIYPHSIVGLDVTDDKIVVGSGDGMARVFDANNQSPVAQWQAHQDWCFTTRFSPDGNLLATGGGDNAIRLWDIRNFQQSGELLAHTDDVHSIVFSQDSKTIFSAGDDNVIRVWDLRTSTQVAILNGHTAQIPRLAINSTGTRIASASRDNTVRLWDVESLECIKVFTQPECDVMAVTFDDMSGHLLSGDENGTIRIWDVESLAILDVIESGLGGVFDLQVSDDGGSLIACGSLGVKIWNYSYGLEPLHRIDNFVSRLDGGIRCWYATNADGQILGLDSVTLQENSRIHTSFGRRGF